MEVLQQLKTAGCPLRISDLKKGADGKRVDLEITLKNHEQKIVQFCEKNKIKPTLFKEVLSGGSSFDDRKELQDLLNRIEEFDCIIVMELPRLARQGTISQMIKDKVIAYRKLIITLNPFKIYDMANNAMDAMFYDFGSAMAEYERRIAGARVKENKLIMARDGKNASGAAPLGYYRDKKEKILKINEEEAEIVRLAFKLCLEGQGIRTIAEELTNRGYRSKKGNTFRRITVRDMLRCQTYKGWIVYKDWLKIGHKKEIQDTIVYKNAHEAIIDPEVFDQVQSIVEQRAERYGNSKEQIRERETVDPSCLKHLVFCSCCGMRMRIVFEATRGHMIRKCLEFKKEDGSRCENMGWKTDYLEAKIIQIAITEHKAKLEEKIEELRSADLQNFTEDLVKQKEDLEKQLKRLAAQYKAIRTQERNYLAELEETGVRDPEEEEAIEEDKKANKEARIKVQKSIDDLDDRIRNQPTPEIEIRKAKEKLNIIEEIKKNPSAEKMNFFLKQIIKKIYYKRILPPEILKLGSKNQKRKEYPAEIEIEWF
jgi:DNA invertase Pin-like site-specific DNA recombinase